MTLVVDLGLERFPPLDAIAVLQQLVAKGFTTCVRELFANTLVLEVAAAEPAKPKTKKKAKAEAEESTPIRVTSRWLNAKEAKPILADIKKATAKGTYADFPYDALAGASHVQDLAIPSDGRSVKWSSVELPSGSSLKLISLDDAWLGWEPYSSTGSYGIAQRLTAVAIKHRLIVHSA